MREERERERERHTLCAPVVKRSQLLGHRKAQQVAEAEEGEDGAQEGEGVALGVEAAGVGLGPFRQKRGFRARM